jgi:hypothetical protein
MWGVARLVVVAAMLVCAGGSASDEVARPSSAVLPLARIDGWPLEAPASESSTHVVVAYDAAAGRKVWAAAHVAGDGGHGAGTVRPNAVYADLDAVDFTRQVVLVLETAGSSSCPRSVLDVRRRASGTVDVTTTADATDHSCTADLHAYTQILAVDRARLPGARALPTTSVFLDGARADQVGLVTGTRPRRGHRREG